MTYLIEFRLLLQEEKLANFLKLWEEYCLTDQVDGKEIKEILLAIKNSPFAKTFGQIAETVLPLWQRIEDPEVAGDVLRLVLDLQTMNSPLLADLALDFLKKNYGTQKDYNEKLRIIGLRTKQKFQGAITNYELLSHLKKGNFVFHTGGWGVGEVIEMSLLREHVLLEFEGISAIKDLSFENAFKNLITLPSEHFLACRFGNPDALEKLGKEDPVALITLLLKDLGPKTAQEIKEELSELVIPEKDWTKWWQQARVKLKKNELIRAPESSKEPFSLHTEAVSHESRLKEFLRENKGSDHLVQIIYNFLRDFPEILKNNELKQELRKELLGLLETNEPSPNREESYLGRKLQLLFLLEEIFPKEFSNEISNCIQNLNHVDRVLFFIEIVALKKRLLTYIREIRQDWASIFLSLILSIPQNLLRDYLFKELQNDSSSSALLTHKIQELLNRMCLFPEAFFWYFQKLLTNEEIPYRNRSGQQQFLEAYLILLHYLEDKTEYRELVKKMYQLLLAKRYGVIRTLIEGASVEYLREFLLLASKCHILTKQDLRILQNLAEIVQPSLAKKEKRQEDFEIIWTSQEGYQKIQEKLHRLGTVETVENAKEIEAARALGDLRENSEFKFALERRARLQSEMKTLSDQLNQARILTKDDILTNEVSVGTVVDLLDSQGKKIQYTLLGPWDADTDNNILSFQSKFAQTMMGSRLGDTFEFQGERYTVEGIRSFLS